MRKLRSILWKIAGAGLLGCYLTACGGRAELSELPSAEDESLSDASQPLEHSDQTVIALVSSQEEAENTGRLYGIELLSFSEGVAVYSTTKSLEELNSLGRENGYPLLTPDHTLELFEEKD